MNELEEKFYETGVVPVVVLEDAEDAVPLAQALVEGGLLSAEVTFRTAAAEESIRRMTEAFPQICQKAVFAAAVCKTDMSGNTFQIRILFDKCAKYLFLLVTIRLERNIILYIACGMILILFPDMVRLDAKEDIHIQNR